MRLSRPPGAQCRSRWAPAVPCDWCWFRVGAWLGVPSRSGGLQGPQEGREERRSCAGGGHPGRPGGLWMGGRRLRPHSCQAGAPQSRGGPGTSIAAARAASCRGLVAPALRGRPLDVLSPRRRGGAPGFLTVRRAQGLESGGRRAWKQSDAPGERGAAPPDHSCTRGPLCSGPRDSAGAGPRSPKAPSQSLTLCKGTVPEGIIQTEFFVFGSDVSWEAPVGCRAVRRGPR